MSAAPALAMRGIAKRFGRVLANDGISLQLQRGEILALLGENGAGKTTLMSILSGSYVADEGSIEVDGKPLEQGSPRAALDAGIGMVQQHFSLADNHSVLDNIVAGTEPLLGWRRRSARAAKRIAELAARSGFAVDPAAAVADLSVGERQKVEILRVLYRDARILVLDEPTAVLTPQEAQGLFDTVRKLAGEGLAVILITHKLEEALAVSDRVCVLRNGRMAYEALAAEASRGQMVAAMVGSEVARPERAPAQPGEPVLRMHAVRIASAGPQLDLEVRAGEIAGVTGVAGNGQAQLAAVLCGMAEPAAGAVEWFGQPAQAAAVRAGALGIARIPDDRARFGVIGDMTLAENLIMRDRDDFARFGLMRMAELDRHARDLIERFDVRCDSPAGEARQLSGGNMQKLILARELSARPRAIVACQPTRGLDVGAISAVHSRLLAQRAAGAGIVLITEDLDELFELADRIGVMYKGQLSALEPAAGLDIRQVGMMMSGAQPAHN